MSINISGLDIEKIMLNNENITGVYLGDTLIEDFRTKTFFKRDSKGLITNSGYQLVENSDFDSQYSDKWNHFRRSPNEHLNYGCNPSQLSIEDSNLVITIKNNKDNTWTTGMVESKYTVSPNSIIEAKVKLPTKGNYYAVIFTEPDMNYDNYPIGYSESYLLDYVVGTEKIWLGTNYYGSLINDPNEIGYKSYWAYNPHNADYDDYYILGMIWKEEEILYYVNDKIIGRLPTRVGLVNGIQAFNYNSWVSLLLRTSSSTPTNAEDDKIYIDWVRVYNIV